MNKFIHLSQGLYYTVTGIWPILHIDSFMLVTGPKTDLWLVKMVGLLSVSTGITILAMIKAKTQFRVLNYATALSFLVIDVYYASIDRISNIYLADAAIQILFIVLLASAGSVKKQPHR